MIHYFGTFTGIDIWTCYIFPPVLSSSFPRSFLIPVRSEKLNEEEEEDGLSVTLKFTHTQR